MTEKTAEQGGVSLLSLALRSIRIHQWAKNLLIFVPLITGHLLSNSQAVIDTTLGFVSFSLLASSIYLINDILDAEADRGHPTKHARPIASGQISTGFAIALSVSLALLGLVLGIQVGLAFLGALLAYAVGSLSYSLLLKRKMFADVVTLAILYTLRIIAGAAAIDVAPSVWILTFSLFFFLSLALMKRYIELDTLQHADQRRSYEVGDLQLIMSAGISSGFLAVLVAALYIDSPMVTELYETPELLWLIIPTLAYWITRTWGAAIHRKVDDDPVLFALKDSVSLFIVVFIGVVTFLGTVLAL